MEVYGMNILNILEIAGSLTAVSAIAGCGLVFLGAMCVGILREFGLNV